MDASVQCKYERECERECHRLAHVSWSRLPFWSVMFSHPASQAFIQASKERENALHSKVQTAKEEALSLLERWAYAAIQYNAAA